ncbi:MAG TPA: amino acid ABC transporter permease [Gammaproteobacteria bacterium]|nr:amino acid ABC transporter permease [Gammaproteobacteria bacterium]
MFVISKTGWQTTLTRPETQQIGRSSSPKWWKSRAFDVIQFIVFTCGLVWITLQGAANMHYAWQWHRVPQYLYKVIDGELIWGPLVDGLFVTLEIGGYSIVLGLFIGLITAFLRLSGSFSGRLLATVYLEIVRNTPLLIQLFVFYFILGPILQLDRFWIAVLCISFFEGSFASEIMRAGILSVPKGQAIPIMLPPLAGIIVNLIKHSAIVSVIAVFDLTTAGLDIISETFMAFEIWLLVAVIYLSITVTLSILIGFLERHMKQSV